jgi:hypothetical protein
MEPSPYLKRFDHDVVRIPARDAERGDLQALRRWEDAGWEVCGPLASSSTHVDLLVKRPVSSAVESAQRAARQTYEEHGRQAAEDKLRLMADEQESQRIDSHIDQLPDVERERLREDATSSLSPPLRRNFGIQRQSFGSCGRAPICWVVCALGLARLGQDCAGADEFDSRMSALAEVLVSLVVAPVDGLAPGQQQPGPLERLRLQLTAELPTSSHARIEGAVRTLRAAVRVRVGGQHSGAAKDAARRFETPWCELSAYWMGSRVGDDQAEVVGERAPQCIERFALRVWQVGESAECPQ